VQLPIATAAKVREENIPPLLGCLHGQLRHLQGNRLRQGLPRTGAAKWQGQNQCTEE